MSLSKAFTRRIWGTASCHKVTGSFIFETVSMIYLLPETVNCWRGRAAGWWPHTPAASGRVGGGRGCCEFVEAVMKWWGLPSPWGHAPAWQIAALRCLPQSFPQWKWTNKQLEAVWVVKQLKTSTGDPQSLPSFLSQLQALLCLIRPKKLFG